MHYDVRIVAIKATLACFRIDQTKRIIIFIFWFFCEISNFFDSNSDQNIRNLSSFRGLPLLRRHYICVKSVFVKEKGKVKDQRLGDMPLQKAQKHSQQGRFPISSRTWPLTSRSSFIAYKRLNKIIASCFVALHIVIFIIFHFLRNLNQKGTGISNSRLQNSFLFRDLTLFVIRSASIKVSKLQILQLMRVKR